MGIATIIEKLYGTDFVGNKIYGSWWFSLLWALLTILGIYHIVRKRLRNPITLFLHFSFVIILFGALLTHLTSKKGIIHLRVDEPTSTFLLDDGSEQMKIKNLPFSITLDSFSIKYHNGTQAVSDYESLFTINDGKEKILGKVSMNKIFSYHSFRFYQSSYTQDLRGSTLKINSDPYGTPTTYFGYGLLFLSLILMLIDPKGGYRQILKNPILKKGILTFCLLFGFSEVQYAANVLPKETAKKFGEISILYNNRICPLETFAIDFTKKLYGNAHYKNYTPEQVLSGFIFWGDEWSKEPILKVKQTEVREKFKLPKYCSVNSFFNNDQEGYILGPLINEYYGGNDDNLFKQAALEDDVIQLVMDLRHGKLLKVFPYTNNGKTSWYSPTEKILDETINEDQLLFIHNVFSLIYEHILMENYDEVDEILNKIIKYQKSNAGESLPSNTQIKAETLYNKFPIATILFMLNLTMGFLSLIFAIWKLIDRKVSSKIPKLLDIVTLSIFILSLIALTICICLRWIIRGNIPLTNGYETMILLAWFIMLLTLIVYRRFKIIITFGFLMSGFFLLVSHIAQMDPNITPIMPILSSPWLSIHVSMVMMSFAMLSLTFICGITALILYFANRKDIEIATSQSEALQILSQLFLYPAIACLSIGIFVGAIWANVSWGSYWSWDAKEVWGLITLMVYAVAIHSNSLPKLKRPIAFHIYMILAFLTILMTYFGVNYFLGGMHSYA